MMKCEQTFRYSNLHRKRLLQHPMLCCIVVFFFFFCFRMGNNLIDDMMLLCHIVDFCCFGDFPVHLKLEYRFFLIGREFI